MHVHAAVDDPDKAIAVIERAPPHLAEFLALSASSPFWRGEPTGLAVVAADGLLGVPALGRAAALRELRGRTPSSSASSSAPAASPTTRTSGGTSASTRGSARSSCGSATRSRASRTWSRSPRTSSRSSSTTASSRGRARSRRPPPDPHHREQVARRALRARGAGDGPRHGRGDRVPSRSSSAARSAISSRTRASSAASASSRASPRSCARQRRRPPAPDLEREPRHRRGRPRSREDDRGRAQPGAVTWLPLEVSDESA